jgi:hypothetical protein
VTSALAPLPDHAPPIQPQAEVSSPAEDKVRTRRALFGT